ncbi:MAG: HAMP domain-containing histidine kinase [Spirochaetaceae bacterium]|jgi:two-component system sensor histidine kinase HydH|nr:HAMP domain-containing histidine kinase [Spirochaetaceae bacterium]
MKKVNLPRRGSLAAALLTWMLFSVLAVFIIWGYRDRARLIRNNENERILNTLFAGLRDYDDFGSAIEANETLKERIAGLAVYSSNLSPIYRWGKAPEHFDPEILEEKEHDRFNRYFIPDRRGRSVKFVIHNERQPRPPRSTEASRPLRTAADGGQSAEPSPPQNPRSLWFSSLAVGNYIYIDINHTAYWNTITFTDILYPLCVTLLLLLVAGIRFLYLRNIEYRQRIEGQQNLVVLGTAASTLAHEIKNPLHSIRLQTGILKKMNPAAGAEEITRIEEEVDRLAALSYRVNDYLRDAAGSPESIHIAEVVEETSRRICGRSILEGEGGEEVLVRMDRGRACSVFENIIRNALEAGGEEKAIRARIKKEGGNAVVIVEDRGKGIPREDMLRITDPFYTSKSTGTGIGLTISKRFVEAAGGTMVLENRSGGGVSVRITVPCES